MHLAAVSSDDPDLLRWAREHGAVCATLDEPGLRQMLEAGIDYLFSINNPVILRPHLLDRVQKLAINFHDSMLPGYAGLNAPSWALLNGEATHGISWHVMEPTVDAGPVLIERSFDVASDETAFSLGLKCYSAALDGFEELLLGLRSGGLRARRQDAGRRRYFGIDSLPRGCGLLDFSLSAIEIERIGRALEFGPSFNPLCIPKITGREGDWLAVGTIRAEDLLTGASPGVVQVIDHDSWVVATGDGAVRLRNFRRSNGLSLTASDASSFLDVRRGGRLVNHLWDAERLASTAGALKRHEAFWRQRLASTPAWEVPRGLIDPYVRSGTSEKRVIEISRHEVAESSEAEVATAFAVVMADLFDSSRVPLGLADEQSNPPGFELSMWFSRQVPLVLDLAGNDMCSHDWREHVSRELQLSRAHVGFASDLVLRDPALRSKSGAMPAEVLFSSQHGADAGGDLGDCLIRLESPGRSRGESPWRLRVSGRMSLQQVEWLADRVVSALGQLRSGITPGEVVPASSEERAYIRSMYFSESRPSPSLGTNLAAALERAADVWADRCAVVEGLQRMSYGELAGRAESVSRGLVAAGLADEELIGLSCDRSIDQVVGLWAILKAGCGVFPVSRDQPASRLASMVALAGVRAIVRSSSAFPFDIPGVEELAVDRLAASGRQRLRNRSVDIESGRTAYLVFTSGTTGEPKGVPVSQSSILDYIAAFQEIVGLGPDDRVLQFSSLDFDVSMEEVLGALVSGATLVLRDEQCLGSAASFTDFLERSGATLVDLPTAYFHRWVEGLSSSGGGLPSTLRTVIVGGEHLLPAALQRWFDLAKARNITLYNSYGPAETTVAVTFGELTEPATAISIGRVIPNRSLIPVGRRGRVRPVGLEGELCIGGAGVAEGYLGRKDLSVERFVDLDLWNDGEQRERVYRSGDAGWVGKDGRWYLGGRFDRQVKVRGYRVELEGVESCLSDLSGVSEAAVLEDGGRLFAVVAANDLTSAEVREQLARRLPEYMVPARIVIVDRLRISAHGKIDRDWVKRQVAGSQRAAADDSSQEGTEAPALTEDEAGVLRCFCRALGRSDVTLDGDFFDLGGDSLGVVQLLSELEGAFGLRLPLSDFLERPTVTNVVLMIAGSGLGAHESLRKSSRVGTPQGTPGDRAGIERRGPIVIVSPLGSAASRLCRVLSWSHRPVFDLSIRVQRSDGTLLEYADVDDMVDASLNDLRVLLSPSRRCQLIGYSFGGLVSCGLARRLEEEGWDLRPLVLVDPSLPGLRLRDFAGDHRVRAYRRGTLERRLERPASLRTARGRFSHGFNVLRDRLCIRTRYRWLRIQAERARNMGSWKRRLTADEELAWFLRNVRRIERDMALQPFKLNAPVRIILASDSYRDDVELRWRLLTGESTEMSVLEGDHTSILTERETELSDRIKRFLV